MKLLVVSLAATVGIAAGCSEKANRPVPKKQQPIRVTASVLIPESVQGKWQAVKIAAFDKNTKEQHVYTIPIGGELKLPDSDLTLKVQNFLPHFVMDGTTFTSASNEPRNPAAQLSIREGGREIFRGWLFKLYPTTHAFQHPQYSLTLVDGIPAR
jgi:hypothetical protein